MSNGGSVANLKTEGNKGNNMPYQMRSLQIMAQIAQGVYSPSGLATEGTALAILAALQTGQLFESHLVVDQGGVGCPAACPTYLEVQIFDSGSGTFDPPIYYDASGALVVPVGPLEFVNPQYVLDNILLEVTSINAKTPALGAQVLTSVIAAVGGTVTAGASSVGFTTDSSFTGTINGVARAASTFYGFEAVTGRTLPAILYTVTGGSVTIDKIV